MQTAPEPDTGATMTLEYREWFEANIGETETAKWGPWQPTENDLVDKAVEVLLAIIDSEYDEDSVDELRITFADGDLLEYRPAL